MSGGSGKGGFTPAVLGALTVLLACQPGGMEPATGDLHVPPGFELTELASGIEGVRTLKFGPDGLLWAVRSADGVVVRLDPGGNGPAEEVLSGLNRPYGLAFHDGWTYVGERHRIVRYRTADLSGPEVVVPDLPTGGSHWTREIVFGPDDMLYLSVGSSCNVCEEEDPRRAAVIRYAPDGSGETIIARGVRNAAGLAFHPGTGQLWASQNERDALGDDVPDEEINVLSDGEHFGWPYCYGDRIPNPEYADRADFCASTVPPALGMQAHSAPLGMVFYTADQFPEEYRGDLFVAFHGSWNRTQRTGYKLVRVRVRDGRPASYEDFAWGWLKDGDVSGRPVYPAVGPDGSLYLSDDGGGRIYRIRWIGGAG